MLQRSAAEKRSQYTGGNARATANDFKYFRFDKSFKRLYAPYAEWQKRRYGAASVGLRIYRALRGDLRDTI